MGRCFVIQPFDGGQFDKRFEDTLKPAIEKAGLEAYRVDRDDSAAIPIEAIEKGIRDAEVCLADITLPKPNVWFEVGFAIASGKQLVMICLDSVDKFPFDIQHRAVITYKTESPTDFQALSAKLTNRLKAAINTATDLANIATLSPLASIDGLTDHEMVALVSICEEPDYSLSTWMLQDRMKSAGYTPIAATLAVRSLINKRLVEYKQVSDDRGNEYMGNVATDAGFHWLDANQDKLVLKEPRSSFTRRPPDDFDAPPPPPIEDIPF